MVVELGVSAGFVTTAPTSNPTGDTTAIMEDAARGIKVTTTDSVTITEMGWWSDNATEESNFEVGIYSHDSGNDKPDALLFVNRTNAKGTTSGWKVVSGLDWDLDASTIYWIIVQVDEAGISEPRIDRQSGATGERITIKSATTLTDPFNPLAQQDNILYSIYALIESAPTATTRKIKIDGTFVDKPIKTKIAGSFEDKPIQIKVGGNFQDA